MVNIWNSGNNLQDLRGKNHCKNVGLVNYLAIYNDFHGLKQSLFFYTCIPEKKFAVITQDQSLHSIITYVGCYLSLNNKKKESEATFF